MSTVQRTWHSGPLTRDNASNERQDRLCVCPRLFGRDDVSFFGVFDGTVGDFAADFVHVHLAPILADLPKLAEAVAALDAGDLATVRAKAEAALREAFEVTDRALIRACAERALHYASSTAVTALRVGAVLAVAHVGDSRVAYGHEASGVLRGIFVTSDHKPDNAEELRRIERAGGSLTYLHGGKPFIRGGDFTARQARGERPMQLNYSRAFGGKDLKMFGLSCVPDVWVTTLDSKSRVLVLASDGLWDVITADAACTKAVVMRTEGHDPAATLADFALAQHDMRGTIDNVTVLVVFF